MLELRRVAITACNCHQSMNVPSQISATLRIANAIGELPRVVAFVETFGRGHGLPVRAVNNLNLCLDEILSNTISYGYDGPVRRVISVSLSVDGGLSRRRDRGRRKAVRSARARHLRSCRAISRAASPAVWDCASSTR